MKVKDQITNLFLCGMLGFLVCLVGCAITQLQFVVLRDVPESPSFVVIPVNDYLNEVIFANTVESALISSGVRVVKRPSTKEVTTERTISGAHGNQAAGEVLAQSGDAKLREKYLAYDQIRADYIVQTYSDSAQCKFVKRETEEVLAIIIARSYYDELGELRTGSMKIRSTLANLGIPVSNNQSER